jgi:hypothetical protein
MSALEKEPGARPQTATAFANALRANADGLGAHYRRAFAIYSEHFPTVLKVSLLAHIPVFVVFLGLLWARLAGVTGDELQLLPFAVLGGLASWVTASCISGAMAILVTQLSVAPLRPLRFRDSFAGLRAQWKPFLKTGGLVALRVVAGFILLFIPGLVLISRYLVWAPVVLLEGLQGSAALKRSAQLTKRSWRDAFLAMLFQLGVPAVVQSWLDMLISYDMRDRVGESGLELISQFAALSSVLVAPLVSIVPALLYLKMRQLGGEAISGTMLPLAGGGNPRRWETRGPS